MARGRKAQEAADNTAPTAKQGIEETIVEAPVKRRGRRTKTLEPVNETSVLIDVVLRARGIRGATPDILHSVVAWAQSIREEGETIKNGKADSPRRLRSELSSDRLARYEMNQALLNGVLAGTILLNVEENGDLVFRKADIAGVATAATETAIEELRATEP